MYSCSRGSAAISFDCDYSRAPHFSSLSIHLLYNPCTFSLVLNRNALHLQVISTQKAQAEEDDDDDGFFVEFKKETARRMHPIHHQTEKKEEEEEEEQIDIFSCTAHHTLEEDSDGHHALVALLKFCGSQNDPFKGSILHADILKKGLLEKHTFVGNTLVGMYAKCGMLPEAQDVFDKLPTRNVVSWSALIAGYAQHGHGEEALTCFERMEQEGVMPNRVTFLCILKACAILGAVDKGRDLHDTIKKDGLLGEDAAVGTALIDMYAKCGLLVQAQEVFDKLSTRNVVSFSALISGYLQHGHGEEALKCFNQMKHEGLSPNLITFVSILKACGSTGAVDKGREVHIEIVRAGLLEKDTMVANALVDMYCKCSALTEAQHVFDKLYVRDIISWNSLITGYAQNDHGEEALYWFEQMKLEGFSPNSVTFIGTLKACGSVGDAYKGQEIHAEILKKGVPGEDMAIGKALVDMYAKCALLVEAQGVFDKLPVKCVVSWNTLIAGYSQLGYGEEALNCFEQMQSEGASPNAITFVSTLKACVSLGAAGKAQDIHLQIVQEGLLGTDMVVGTALVDMYAKFGSIEKAQKVFDKLSARDVVAWSALIVGYAEDGRGQEALERYEQMQCEGLSPNAVTFIGVSKACGSIGAASIGREMHAEILQRRLLEKDVVVGTSLVDMYGKLGLLAQAEEIFCRLPFRSAVSWNALLSGYSQLGEAHNVFSVYDGMIKEGLAPNLVTCTIVLNTCSHTGLLDKGHLYFKTMIKGYGIIPTAEHYNCMVDLFSRAGQLDTALAVFHEMPCTANLTGWHIVLSACQKLKNSKLGIVAFERAAHLCEMDADALVCLSNIYAAAGSQEDT